MTRSFLAQLLALAAFQQAYAITCGDLMSIYVSADCCRRPFDYLVSDSAVCGSCFGKCRSEFASCLTDLQTCGNAFVDALQDEVSLHAVADACAMEHAECDVDLLASELANAEAKVRDGLCKTDLAGCTSNAISSWQTANSCQRQYDAALLAASNCRQEVQAQQNLRNDLVTLAQQCSAETSELNLAKLGAATHTGNKFALVAAMAGITNVNQLGEFSALRIPFFET